MSHRSARGHFAIPRQRLVRYSALGLCRLVDRIPPPALPPAVLRQGSQTFTLRDTVTRARLDVLDGRPHSSILTISLPLRATAVCSADKTPAPLTYRGCPNPHDGSTTSGQSLLFPSQHQYHRLPLWCVLDKGIVPACSSYPCVARLTPRSLPLEGDSRLPVQRVLEGEPAETTGFRPVCPSWQVNGMSPVCTPALAVLPSPLPCVWSERCCHTSCAQGMSPLATLSLSVPAAKRATSRKSGLWERLVSVPVHPMPGFAAHVHPRPVSLRKPMYPRTPHLSEGCVRTLHCLSLSSHKNAASCSPCSATLITAVVCNRRCASLQILKPRRATQRRQAARASLNRPFRPACTCHLPPWVFNADGRQVRKAPGLPISTSGAFAGINFLQDGTAIDKSGHFLPRSSEHLPRLYRRPRSKPALPPAESPSAYEWQRSVVNDFCSAPSIFPHPGSWQLIRVT